MQFSILGTDGSRSRLIVDLQCWERPENTDIDDGNWINARLDLTVGGFRARFDLSLRADEFPEFLQQLRTLDASLVGIASFRTLEDQLAFELQGDGKGHLEVRGHAAENSANRLQWRMEADQTCLARLIQELESVTAAFPVRGARR